MKLVYIYIHNFGNIYQQGFNLSSNYRVNFSFKYNSSNQTYIDPILEVDSLKTKLPYLFHENIVDIKGIVGENGAGKTTLLRYLVFLLNNNLMFFNRSDVHSKDILVYEIKDESGLEQLKVVSSDSWNLLALKIRTNTGQKIYAKSHSGDLHFEEIDDFNHTEFIFYSNIFDNQIEDARKPLHNISTNYLITKDKETWVNEPLLPVSDFLAYKSREFSRQVNFALQFQDKLLPFKLPKSVNLSLNNHAERKIQAFLEKTTKSSISNVEKIAKWQKLVSASIILEADNKARLAHILLHKAYFNYFVYHYILNNSTLDYYPDKKGLFIEQVISELMRQYEKNKRIIDISEFLTFVQEAEYNLKLEHTIAGNTYSVDLSKVSLAIPLKAFHDLEKQLLPEIERSPLVIGSQFQIPLINFIDNYSKTRYITDWLDYSFSGLSSGESSFLTIFSRFYSLIDTNQVLGNRIEEQIENLIILIDEGDLYFHPQWQAKYLEYLNEILPKIFSRKKIQILITSHSPFLASDLPTNYLLFLRKGKPGDFAFTDGQSLDEKCVIVDGPEYTFASNIHELLAHSFFLQGAHIGGIAKQTIYNILDQLDDKKIPRPMSNVELESVIEIIGEPWIKSRLKEKYQEYKTRLSNTQ